MIIIQTKESTAFVDETKAVCVVHDKAAKSVTVSNASNGTDNIRFKDVIVVRYANNTEIDYVDKGNELEIVEGTLCRARLKLDWFRRREKCYRDIVSRYQSTLRTVLNDASNKNHDEETLRAAIDMTVKDTFKDVDSITASYNKEESGRLEHFGEQHKELIV